LDRISFFSDNFKISGNLSLSNRNGPCIICLHGLDGNKDNSKWLTLSSKLVENGYSCLRFNFRGCGEGVEKSEGNFEDLSLTGRIQDYKSAIDFLEKTEKVDSNRIGSIGSSFGGVVAIVSKDSRIKAITSISSPAKVPQFQEAIIPREVGDYYILPSGRRFRKSFYSDLKKYNILDSVKNSSSLLVLHGNSDEIVSYSHAEKIFKYASEPKRLEIINGADHFFSDKNHLNIAINFILEWFNKYI